jgi:PAS domain S-box-containing protein
MSSENEGNRIHYKVLICVPTAEDAAVTESITAQSGADAVICADIPDVCAHLKNGADAVIVSEELLDDGQSLILAEALRKQPGWSDPPVLLVAAGGRESRIAAETMREIGNVLLLDRPVHLSTLQSALQMALRTRDKQKQIRDLLEERLRRERALLESERKYRSLFQSMSEGFALIEIILDESGNPADYRVLEVNRAFETLTGLSPETVINRAAREFMPDLEKNCIKRFEYVGVTGQPAAFQHFVEPLGKWLEFYAFSPERGRVGIFFLDITERKEMEKTLVQRTLELQELTETLEGRVRERTVELSRANEGLQYLSSRLLTAQEEERRRIAGEVHDSFSASLSAIKYNIEFALREIGSNSKLEDAVAQLHGTMEESRRIQMALRPSILDDLGFLAAMNWFCREFQKTYFQIEVQTALHVEEHEIPEPLKIILFRISQEAFNNIAKHSKANSVSLSLTRADSRLELVIRDNGTGFDIGETQCREASTRGLGLSSMRERATLSGGSFQIDSNPGMGTVIRVCWPLP